MVFGLFRWRPRSRPDYSESHIGKGVDYDSRFFDDSPRALMWQFEKRIVREVSNRSGRSIALDFATGTGRIACEMKAQNHLLEVVGVDISPTMLDVARGKGCDIVFETLDVRNESEWLRRYADRFDIIVAFRFFANADSFLREQAAKMLSQSLKSSGIIVVNNHRNFWSIPYLARRILQPSFREGCLNSDIVSIFDRQALHLAESWSLGIWPQTDYRFIGPKRVVQWVESLNYTHFSKQHRLGYNQVLVFSRR